MAKQILPSNWDVSGVNLVCPSPRNLAQHKLESRPLRGKLGIGLALQRHVWRSSGHNESRSSEKGLMLLQRFKSLVLHRFNLWPGNLYVLWAWPKKKKGRKKELIRNFVSKFPRRPFPR